VLERVQQTIEAGRNPVVVFDLDATLYDNRPRTLEILMEYREEVFESHPDVAEALGVVTAERIEYLLSDSLRGCGITRSDIVQDITRFWRERFFTDEYVQRDTTIDGAAEYVQACHEAGAIIVYMTGRDVPGMLLGTVASLRDCGFPIGVAGIELVLKPDANLPDEAFKRGALPTLDRLGEMVAFFDNEPANCNLARSMFPESLVVLLETQRVPYAPPLAEDIEVVADFRIG
jgi:beta-phosphoglucomutase-like phosphatase (HAD superfamily)